MKIPVQILQGLAAAVALAGISGCGYVAPTSVPERPKSIENQSADPNAENHERPGKVCEPAACPACGRG
jgi:hypothetical protein